MIHRPPLHDDSDSLAAKRAIVKSEASLAYAVSRTVLVSELSNKLKIEGSRNHFIQRLNMHKPKGDNVN